MSNTVFFITILVLILLGALSVGIRRLTYKKNITFYVMAIMMIPLMLYAIAGFVGGAKGIIHLLWAAPLGVFCSQLAFLSVSRLLERPLNEMKNVVKSLTEGNVNVTYDEKFKKGDHELAQMMRLLSNLAGLLKKIAAFAGSVGKGNLNVDYSLQGENDVLGSAMLEMRANLQVAESEKEERRREDERRNWITQGVAKFAELLRANNDNIEELCHSIVCNLVKYIGANQAGIFILNEEDPKNPVLELKACYAYERRKFLQKTIELGEGLVGTCFLERESIYMTSLPKDYVHITSGLGEDTPRALLIVPLKVNEVVYGIIEMAAFREFEPHIRDFVEKVSESIASTISAVKVSIRTNKLLVQSKLQAEEMANQEEELRQNMEEMQATQEEMRRREVELLDTLEKMKIVQTIGEEKEYEMKQYHRAIFGTFCVLEFSSDAYIVDINENVLKLFGSTDRSDFVGKHITNFISQEEYEAVWNSAKQGKTHETVQQVEAKGKINHLHQRYLPICNKQGDLLRVLDLIIIENS